MNKVHIKKTLRVIEGLVTLFVLLIPMSSQSEISTGVRLSMIILGLVLTITFLVCRWLLRKEYTKSENFFEGLIGIAFLFLLLYLLLSSLF